MNAKAFFVDALSSALDLGIARPDDVLRHVTPEILAQHLPRPLWARLLTACLGAPRVDPQLVIETIGIANLAEHIPAQLMWGLIADVGARSLGQTVEAPRAVAAPPPAPKPVPLTAPPPPEVISPPTRPTPPPMAAVGPDIPAPASAALTDLINELESSEAPPVRSRTPTAQRFRQSNTGIGRLGSAQRRPQVAATPAAGRPARRGGTEVSDEQVGSGAEIAVDDSQLVDWSSAEQTQATEEDFNDLSRKR